MAPVSISTGSSQSVIFRLALGIEQINAATSRNCDEGIGFSAVPVELGRLEVQTREAAHNFQRAKLLGADIH
jgi:hypothetical protein